MECWDEYFIHKGSSGAVVFIILEIQGVVPLLQAVVQSHVQASCPDTVREAANQVPLWPLIHTVPVPVVGAGEIAPALMVLGCQNNIYKMKAKLNYT